MDRYKHADFTKSSEEVRQGKLCIERAYRTSSRSISGADKSGPCVATISLMFAEGHSKYIGTALQDLVKKSTISDSQGAA